jgi:hypothetical protein
MYGGGNPLYNVPWEVPCHTHHKNSKKYFFSVGVQMLYFKVTHFLCKIFLKITKNDKDNNLLAVQIKCTGPKSDET